MESLFDLIIMYDMIRISGYEILKELYDELKVLLL